MKDKHAIIIKDPHLQKIRNNLRNVFFQAARSKRKEYFNQCQDILVNPDGTHRSVDDLTSDELKKFRFLQEQENQISDMINRSILTCVSCGKGYEDMVYNKAYCAWYCTECYEMHRDYAKELFQTIGKTKPVGHEEEAIHELYETFLDYEESHEIELKLVREDILIYLLRFPDSSDRFSYTTIEEIHKVLERSQKAILHALNSLKDEGIAKLVESSEHFKTRLTQQGLVEAEKILSKVQGDNDYSPAVFSRDFPQTIEQFKILFVHHSNMLEYEYPEIFERLANDLKAEKASTEEIKLRIDELKEIFNY